MLAVAAAVPDVRAEGLPRSLTCSFERGTTTTYGDGAFRSTAAAGIAFNLQAIDLEAQTAELTTGSSGASAKVRIVRALNANHFLEAVNEGFLNLTTVYDRDPARDAWPAVHSRHFGLLGQPVVAQYQGFCKAPGG